MNYALDALWWRLKNPVVRDLASLLTAPVPWHSGHELPVPILLGNVGFRYLLALDQNAEALYTYLHLHPPLKHRLGSYAEHLLAFWFNHASHAKLIWQNKQINRHKYTLGEIDFIVVLNQQCFHIELACKYYGALTVEPNALIGLNKQDQWQGKVAKLNQQLTRLESDEAKQALNAAGLNTQSIQSVSILRGMLFTPNAQPFSVAPLNSRCWIGYCISQWPELSAILADSEKTYHFAVIANNALLAPQRLSIEKTLTWDQLQHISQGIIAVLVKRADGYLHEIQRVMKMA